MSRTIFIRPMLRNSISAKRFKQLGGMMVESLIGLLILSIIGGGVMHATARMANSQQQQAMNNIAVNQMRSLLMNRATAAGIDLCSGTHNLTVPGQTTPVTLAVKGCGNTAIEIKNVKVDGSVLPPQPVSSMRPVVLEMGTGNELIRVGGKEVQTIAAN